MNIGPAQLEDGLAVAGLVVSTGDGVSGHFHRPGYSVIESCPIIPPDYLPATFYR